MSTPLISNSLLKFLIPLSISFPSTLVTHIIWLNPEQEKKIRPTPAGCRSVWTAKERKTRKRMDICGGKNIGGGDKGGPCVVPAEKGHKGLHI